METQTIRVESLVGHRGADSAISYSMMPYMPWGFCNATASPLYKNGAARCLSNSAHSATCGKYERYVYVTLYEVKTSKYSLSFKKPYRLLVIRDDGCYCAEDRSLSMFAFGESIELLMEDVRADFSFMWDFIAQEDDAKLTADAKDVKSWLLNNMSKREGSD